MPFQSTPTKDGVYRIKCLTENLYIESIPKSETTARYNRPWTRLVAPSAGSKKQEWTLIRAPNTPGEWTIQSVFDNAGLIYVRSADTYRGYGFPYPEGQSLQWKISDYGNEYSKLSSNQNPGLVFDSQKMYRDTGDYAVHFWPEAAKNSAPHQCFVFEFVGDIPSPPGHDDLKLDVVFLQDATGSQQPYIDAARTHIKAICLDLKDAGDFQHDDDLRFRLIAFRDHPPQDSSYILKPFDFTSDTATLTSQLDGLRADGGGDGPEAQTDALDAALNSPWRNDAAKVVVIVTDSPPHGIEDSNDGFPNGCPLQLDPCRTINLCAKRGITLHVIACEPTLSGEYSNAKEFYQGMAEKTNGDYVPLNNVGANTQQLRSAVVGLAAKALDTQRLAAKLSSRILAEAHRSHDEIAADIHAELFARGVQHHQLYAADVYAHSTESSDNVKAWAGADSIKEAKAKLRQVPSSRFAAQSRSASASYSVSYKKEPITRENANAIVQKVLKTAGRI